VCRKIDLAEAPFANESAESVVSNCSKVLGVEFAAEISSVNLQQYMNQDLAELTREAPCRMLGAFPLGQPYFVPLRDPYRVTDAPCYSGSASSQAGGLDS
jgi:hypothetical protein